MPGTNVSGKVAYPAEMGAVPKPAAPPVSGSPAATVAGVPAGTVTFAVSTYLLSATETTSAQIFDSRRSCNYWLANI
jgi:hypothetical protein